MKIKEKVYDCIDGKPCLKPRYAYTNDYVKQLEKTNNELQNQIDDLREQFNINISLKRRERNE